jgi:iron complex transport system ATP-binding protein
MEFSMILSLRDLTIQRGDVRILDRVSWSVAPGEHWVILGANGSGKTSLLSALTGYLSPTSGDITVLGQTFGESDWRELRTHVGLVSSSIRQMIPDHEPALTTVISGRYAMIDYWGRVRAEDRTAAQRLLRQVEAKNLAERPWGVLSQGERQRVLIARALMARRCSSSMNPAPGSIPSPANTSSPFSSASARSAARPRSSSSPITWRKSSRFSPTRSSSAPDDSSPPAQTPASSPPNASPKPSTPRSASPAAQGATASPFRPHAEGWGTSNWKRILDFSHKGAKVRGMPGLRQL